ncbi:MAG: dipicolinate synthase subunit B, partial [Clostridia bacterium]|nr:dipicolinate synthase subunit B [Clostridia bacterium]
KFAGGITDGAVNMAIKAHLRCDRPALFCIATNDAVSQNLANIAYAMTRRSVYLLPMYQDNPVGKPYSLVADFSLLVEGYLAMMRGEQLRPLFLC